MSEMQLLDIKRQFLPTSGILATPKPAVRSVDDVHFPKPETLCNRATRRFFAVQNSVQVSAINAGVLSKGALTTLAFNCDSQQINNVILVKYKRGPAQSAGGSKGTSFVIRLGRFKFIRAVSFRDGSDPREFPFFDGRDFLSLSLLISPILLADFIAVLFTISPVVLAAPCAIFWSLLVLAVIFPPSLTVPPRSHGLDSPLSNLRAAAMKDRGK
jgi:hypothetical protein